VTTRVVTPPEKRVKPGLMPSLINPDWCPGSDPVEGLYAVVEAEGFTFEVSQLPGETGWTVDTAYTAGSSCPMWANGFGARYLRTKQLNAELAALLDSEVSTNDFCADLADPS
jgi:hypothetical protein